MNNAIVSACVTIGVGLLIPAALGSTAEISTEYGTPTTFSGAPARTFFQHDGHTVIALGVEVPAALYDKAPLDPPSDGRNDVPVDADDPTQGIAWYCCGYEIVLELPPAAIEKTAFRHVVLNWNPRGHAPAGVYDSAHTDFHFYFTSVEEREAIGRARDSKDMCMVPGADPAGPLERNAQTCEQFQVTAAALPPDQMPRGYVSVGATEPAMGNHLLDPKSHEFHGEAFDHTFIYMSHAGRLTGMEPMITLNFMRGLDKPLRVPIAMPEAFPVAGLYPTEYVVEYDRDGALFRVYYENWKWFPASGSVAMSD